MSYDEDETNIEDIFHTIEGVAARDAALLKEAMSYGQIDLSAFGIVDCGTFDFYPLDAAAMALLAKKLRRGKWRPSDWYRMMFGETDAYRRMVREEKAASSPWR